MRNRSKKAALALMIVLGVSTSVRAEDIWWCCLIGWIENEIACTSAAIGCEGSSAGGCVPDGNGCIADSTCTGPCEPREEEGG